MTASIFVSVSIEEIPLIVPSVGSELNQFQIKSVALTFLSGKYLERMSDYILKALVGMKVNLSKGISFLLGRIGSNFPYQQNSIIRIQYL